MAFRYIRSMSADTPASGARPARARFWPERTLAPDVGGGSRTTGRSAAFTSMSAIVRCAFEELLRADHNITWVRRPGLRGSLRTRETAGQGASRGRGRPTYKRAPSNTGDYWLSV